MSDEPSSLYHGDFCWVELMSNEIAQARHFYSSLFSVWQVQVNQFDYGDYTIFYHEEMFVAGLTDLNEAINQQGVQPSWNSYLRVGNVDEIVDKAKQLGASVIKEPYDVFQFGRGAVITDPCGALFYLWQSTPDDEQFLDQSMQGAFCLQELLTTDFDLSLSFYTQLFGWKFDHQAFNDGSRYIRFWNNGRCVAVMREMPKSLVHTSAYWKVYFAVDDCDQFVSHALNHGARVMLDPKPVFDGARYATFQDPQGATFSAVSGLSFRE